MIQNYREPFLDYCFSKEPSVFAKRETKETLNEYFDQLQDVEVSRGTELHDLSHLEVSKIVASIAADFSQPNAVVLSITKVLYLYGVWCRKNGYTESHVLQKLRQSVQARFVLRSVTTPEALKSALDLCFEPAENCTADCIDRGIVWLLFYGLTPSEIYRLTTTDFSPVNNTLQVGSKTLALEGDALVAIRNLAMLDRFYLIHDLYKKQASYRMRYYGNDLFRRSETSRPYPDFTTLEARNRDLKMVFRSMIDPDRIGLSPTLYSVAANGAFIRAAEIENRRGISKSREQMYSTKLLKVPYGVKPIDELVSNVFDGELSFSYNRRANDNIALQQVRRKVYHDYSDWREYFNV